MQVRFDGELRRVEAREFTKKDGTKGTSYNLLVESGADSLQFPTVFAVHEQYEKGFLYKGAECEFLAEYNLRYQFNNFVVQSVALQ